MDNVSVETETICLAGSVMLKIGGIRIEVSISDYQAMLAAIDADISELHRIAQRRERQSLERMKRSFEAVDELRSILYEKDDDFFLLRKTPDSAAISAFIDKHSQLMGFG